MRDAECWGLKGSICSLHLPAEFWINWETDIGNGHWGKKKQNRTRLRCGARMDFLFPFLPSVAGEAFVVDRLCLQSTVSLLSSWKTVAQRTPRGRWRPCIADLPSGEEWTKDVRLSAQVTGSWSFSWKPVGRIQIATVSTARAEVLTLRACKNLRT